MVRTRGIAACHTIPIRVGGCVVAGGFAMGTSDGQLASLEVSVRAA